MSTEDTAVQIIAAVDQNATGMSRLADRTRAAMFLPGMTAMRAVIDAASRFDVPIVGLFSLTHPRLVARALLHPNVKRVAIYHDKDVKLGAARRACARALFAAVDLTIVSDEASERDALRLGADPERIARSDEDVVDRIVAEPRRGTGPSATAEAAASLALDALQASGLIRLLEKMTTDRGTNVINYHRVLPSEELKTYGRPQMALADGIFDAQLDAFRAQRGFICAEDAKNEEARGKVGITFDDGYEDNYRVALPILNRHETPASVFLVSDFVDNDQPLWWDTVQAALFQYFQSDARPPIPPRLPDPAPELRNAESYAEARHLITSVLSAMNDLPDTEQALATEAALALVPDFTPPRTMMSWKEVEGMAASGVHFGSHTQTHTGLDRLDRGEAARELVTCQKVIEDRLGPLEYDRIAALPRGIRGPLKDPDFRRAGFDAIMTTSPGINSPRDRSVYIKRRDGRMLTLRGRHHPAKLRIELTGIVDFLRRSLPST